MDEFEDDPSERLAWRALASIKELATVRRSDSGADAALEAIREKLFQIQLSESVGKPALGSFRSAVHRISGRDEHVEAVIDWLASTGRFKKRNIQHIRRVKVFAAQESGRVIIRAQPLSEMQATVAIAILSVVVGVWITWIWLGAAGSIQLIAISFGLGILFGHVVGMIADRSFRFAKLRSDVLEVAPWLGAGVSVA